MKKVLIFALTLITYLLVTIVLGKLFEILQVSMFRSPADVLFMHSKITNAIIPIGLLLCFFVLLRFYTTKSEPKRYLIALALFITTSVISFINIFTYSSIGNDGIIVRKNMIEEAKSYTWTEVTSADIDYSYGKDQHGDEYVIFEYDLILNDGSRIHFRNSEEFRSYDRVKYITEFLKTKEVKISRATINQEDFDLIVSNYENEYGTDTEKMFRELYRVVGE